MRYYEIQITEQDGSPITDIKGQTIGPFTSLMTTGRTTNPAALNVYIDIPVTAYDSPIGTSGLVRVWGLPLYMISQAFNLNGKKIVVRGGMSPGLPLANPAQRGILVTATIQQAFGNWQGVNQTLDMYVKGSTGGALAPRDISFNWQQGTKMATAIENALRTAYGKEGYGVEIDISDNLVAYETMPGSYSSLQSFAQVMRSVSRDILKNNLYPGVRIVFDDKTFYVYDVSRPGSIAANPVFLNFEDFVGQPTWIGPNRVSFKTVMRGDIQMGDYVKFPTQTSAYQFSTAGAQTQARQRPTFSGSFIVQTVRHLGDYRQKGGDSWSTVFEALDPSIEVRE